MSGYTNGLYDLWSTSNKPKAGYEYTAEGFGNKDFWDTDDNGNYMNYTDNNMMDGSDDFTSNQGGWFDGWSNKDMIGAGVGIGQVGLGLANYFENKKMNKKRMSGIDEQIASSRYSRNRHKEFVSNTNKSFGA